MIEEKNNFEQVSHMIREFVNPPLQATIDTPGHYEVWSEKKTSFKGKPVDRVFFLSAVMEHSHIALYFNPIFSESELHEIFAVEFLERIEEKSCISIRHLNPQMKKDLATAIMKIYNYYIDKGWI